MPQHDYNIINAPGAAVRADMNGAFSATQSQNSGPSEPAATIAYMTWVDTTTKTHKRRNSADSGWIIEHKIDLKIIHKDDIGANKVSAPTVDLATATGKLVNVTGSGGPITSFGNVEAGFNFIIVFSSTPTIVHNVVSLILPGAINIVAKANDVMMLVSLGGGNWRCTNFLTSSASPFPTGAKISFAGPVTGVPNGWLLCDGRAHSTLANPELQALFDLIQNIYGGSDNTNFRVPDHRGRTGIGMDDYGDGGGEGSANRITDSQADVLGGSGGIEAYVLQPGEAPSHQHTEPGHSHSISANPGTGFGGTANGAMQPVSLSTSISSSSAGGFTTAVVGNDEAHENTQPWIAGIEIIKI